VLWLCQDLLPFELIEKEGFQAFNKKNIHPNLPTSRALATTGLKSKSKNNWQTLSVVL